MPILTNKTIVKFLDSLSPALKEQITKEIPLLDFSTDILCYCNDSGKDCTRLAIQPCIRVKCPRNHQTLVDKHLSKVLNQRFPKLKFDPNYAWAYDAHDENWGIYEGHFVCFDPMHPVYHRNLLRRNF